MTPAILALNAGSSSLKFALFEAGTLAPLARGVVDAINVRPVFSVNNALHGNAATRDLAATPIPHEAAAQAVFDWLASSFAASHRLVAIGHRIVHGGPRFDTPRRVEGGLLADLQAIIPLAPLHQPQGLAVIAEASKAAPGVPQVACFDTAFHHAMPPEAQAIAIPRRFTEQGVRRYGFHGLSYEFIAGKLAFIDPRAAQGRTIVAHLGNGASLCAMHNGKSVATSMGFSALDGLVMGTRPGSIDPGVIFYLHMQHGMAIDEIQRTFYKESGLLGVSGISSDVRELLASADPRAKFALDLFAYRAAREIASHAAAMQGIDAIVFTGGIGEHAAPVRAAICDRCRWHGLDLDAAANVAHAQRISAPTSRIAAYVIPTDEEVVIARHAAALAAEH
ncbi:MAG: acetate/propionate family kinase [Phycisphaerales bacterium]